MNLSRQHRLQVLMASKKYFHTLACCFIDSINSCPAFCISASNRIQSSDEVENDKQQEYIFDNQEQLRIRSYEGYRFMPTTDRFHGQVAMEIVMTDIR